MKKKSAGTLRKNYRILAGPNEWQQVCNRSNPEKTGRSCEGVDFSWWSSKVSRTLPLMDENKRIAGSCPQANGQEDIFVAHN
jgi:hypothetical protein